MKRNGWGVKKGKRRKGKERRSDEVGKEVHVLGRELVR